MCTGGAPRGSARHQRQHQWSGRAVAGDLPVVTAAVEVYGDGIPVRANICDKSLSQHR